jgi:hypothetical protein
MRAPVSLGVTGPDGAESCASGHYASASLSEAAASSERGRRACAWRSHGRYRTHGNLTRDPLERERGHMRDSGRRTRLPRGTVGA